MLWEQAIRAEGSYKAGKVLGFGVSFVIFASIFYLVLGFFDKLPGQIQYLHVLSFVIIAYALGLLAWGRKKWGL